MDVFSVFPGNLVVAVILSKIYLAEWEIETPCACNFDSYINEWILVNNYGKNYYNSQTFILQYS